MDQNGWTGGNYPAPNGQNANAMPPVSGRELQGGAQQARQTQYMVPPNNPQTTPLNPPPTGYIGNQTPYNGTYGQQNVTAQQYNNYAGAYNNSYGQNYSNRQVSNNYQPQHYGAYQAPQRNKKSSGPMLYVLIAVVGLCVVAAIVLCIYLAMDSGSDKSGKKPNPNTNRELWAVTDASTTAEPEPEIEDEDFTPMPPAAIIPDDPYEETQEQTEERTEERTEEPDSDYEYLDELNRRYNNYFDFRPDEDGFVIADSEYRILTEQDLHGMTEHQVCMARNEIYARHGYIFQTEKYNEYFENFSWYRPTTTVLPALSSVEIQNVNMIIAYESARGW